MTSAGDHIPTMADVEKLKAAKRYPIGAAPQPKKARRKWPFRGILVWSLVFGLSAWCWLPGIVYSITDRNTPDGKITVYVADTGSKYHRAGCQYLRKSSSAITLAAAKRMYSPCSKCHPPL
jgi:hypothetical protein